MDTSRLEPHDWEEAARMAPSLTWLPNPQVAEIWREFSEKGTLVPANSPRTAPELSATRDAAGPISLSWRIDPELAGGVRSLRLYRDGKLWKELGPAVEKPIVTSRDAPPEGLRAEPFADEEGGTTTYGLRFLDAAGNESPLAEAEVR